MLEQVKLNDADFYAKNLKSSVDKEHYERARATILAKERIGEKFGPEVSYK